MKLRNFFFSIFFLFFLFKLIFIYLYFYLFIYFCFDSIFAGALFGIVYLKPEYFNRAIACTNPFSAKINQLRFFSLTISKRNQE